MEHRDPEPLARRACVVEVVVEVKYSDVAQYVCSLHASSAVLASDESEYHSPFAHGPLLVVMVPQSVHVDEYAPNPILQQTESHPDPAQYSSPVPKLSHAVGVPNPENLAVRLAFLRCRTVPNCIVKTTWYRVSSVNGLEHIPVGHMSVTDSILLRSQSSTSVLCTCCNSNGIAGNQSSWDTPMTLFLNFNPVCFIIAACTGWSGVDVGAGAGDGGCGCGGLSEQSFVEVPDHWHLAALQCLYIPSPLKSEHWLPASVLKHTLDEVSNEQPVAIQSAYIPLPLKSEHVGGFALETPSPLDTHIIAKRVSPAEMLRAPMLEMDLDPAPDAETERQQRWWFVCVWGGGGSFR
jgi:hypothetical protein